MKGIKDKDVLRINPVDLSVIPVAENDILVFMVDTVLCEESYGRLVESVRKNGIKNRMLLLEDGIRVGVIKDDSVERKSA